MHKKKKTGYSLSCRAGIIVGVFVFLIIFLFGWERYILEKERILNSHRLEFEQTLEITNINLKKLAEELWEIENNPALASSENLKAAGEFVQPVINQFQQRKDNIIITFYSPNLKTIIAVSPEDKYKSIIGNSFDLCQNNPRPEERINIAGLPLNSIRVKDHRGNIRGHLLAFIPSNIFKRELFAGLQKPLIITFIAVILSLGFSAFLSQKIKKSTFSLQRSLHYLQDNQVTNERQYSSLPFEFIPLFNLYSRMIKRHYNLTQELSMSARTAVLGNMIGVIAHDVKNPLAIIKNSAQMGLHSKGGDKKDKNLERIIKASEEINLLLEKSLSLVKLPGEEKEEICFKKLIFEIKEIVNLLQVKKNIRYSFEIPENLPRLKGNSLALRQALMNIIQNGVEATPSGGKIIISAEALGKKGILIKVTDTGEGIPQETKKHIFDRFFTTKGTKGTGLGLALARQIVENHSGKIWAVSQEGEGTTINIFLPFITSA